MPLPLVLPLSVDRNLRGLSTENYPGRKHHPKLKLKFSQLCFRRPSFFEFDNHFFKLSCRAAVQNGDKKVAPILEGIVIESDEWQSVPDIWGTAASQFGDRIALVDPHHQPFTKLTYSQGSERIKYVVICAGPVKLMLRQAILQFSEGLRILGISPNEKVSLFAENSCRWLVADQGIMAAGAVDVVRGTKSSIKELLHIYVQSDSVALVVDNYDLLCKLQLHLQGSTSVKFVILLWGEKAQGSQVSDFELYTYDEVIAKGCEHRHQSKISTSDSSHLSCIKPDDLATLVYTSGTTGDPKGVMLTHANLLHQVQHLGGVVDVYPGDRFLSLLPPWHMYERSCEYFSLSKGIEQIYTNVKNLKEDLKIYSPDYLVSVPLIFDTLYSAVQKQLLSAPSMTKLIALTLIKVSMIYKQWKRVYEGRVLSRAIKETSYIAATCEWILARAIATFLFPLHVLARVLVYKKIHAAVGIKKAGINGGGSLASHVDIFFEAIDITILNGYGLTESSPVVSVRTPTNNVLGTVGKPLEGTEIKIVDPDSGEDIPKGHKGIVKVRGPQIMRGYYKNPAATAKILDMNGWLDTGDIGWIVPDVKIGSGRSCSGNVVLEGRAKDTIVLSTGENVDPTHIEEAAMQSIYIKQIMVVGQDQRRLGALIIPNKDALQTENIPSEDVEGIIRKELNKYTSTCSVPVGPFCLIDDPFAVESGLLTPTMKVRRNAIAEKYSSQIKELFRKQQ